MGLRIESSASKRRRLNFLQILLNAVIVVASSIPARAPSFSSGFLCQHASAVWIILSCRAVVIRPEFNRIRTGRPQAVPNV